MLPESIDVPEFARLGDYSGVWAIEPQAGSALFERAKSIDLAAHVAEADPPKLRSEAGHVMSGDQKIGVVMIAGPLMKSVGSMSAGTSTVRARRDIRQLAKDPEVSAILLMVDSPGGTVAGTASLAADIREAGKSKLVWAYADDLCASAAYWIASQCDQIFANDRTAMVGSIGTLAVLYDYSRAAANSGIRTLVIGTGPIKGAGAIGSEITAEQEAYFRGLVEDAQTSFDAAVSQGRKLSAKQLAGVKTGGVFGASEALDRNLIDGIRSFDQVVTELAAEARRKARASKQAGVTAPAIQRSLIMEPIDTPVDAGAQAAEQIRAQREIAAAELERQGRIAQVCGDNKTLAAQAIREGWTSEKAELEAIKASLPNGVRAMNPAFNPTIISNGREQNCTLEAMQAAMILRAGGKLDSPAYQSSGGFAMKLPSWLQAGLNADMRQKAMEWGHRFSHMSAVDICREALRLDGKDAPIERDAIIHAAISGGSLTSIFTTSVNARMLTAYMQTADTTGGWTNTTDVSDFKTNERFKIEIGGGLTKMPRGGEADHGSYSDVSESYKIARYAKQIFIDEQDMIDDNFQALSRIAPDMGMAAARLRPDLVYYILLSNPTLAATARALFNATDGNLDTTAGLAQATIKAAISSMMLFQENGVTLNLVPSHLIVPPTLKWTAKELLNSTQIVIAAAGTTDASLERGNANTIADENLQLVAEPRLENGVTDPDSGTTAAGSASTWFLAAMMAHTIEVAYRTGTGRAPQSRSWTSTGKGQWGIGWDINQDIGVKAIDWKGLHKATA